jgi:hypothetical protein
VTATAPRPEVYVHSEVNPDGVRVPSFRTRRETLRTMAVHATVDRRYLAAADADDAVHLVRSDLHFRLQKLMTETGRLPVGDIVVDQREDHLRDVVMFRATVKTRESDQGEWPAIYAAAREDGWWWT